MNSTTLPYIHIGGMRTGSSHLQQLFIEHPEISLRLKTRFFSFDSYFDLGGGYLNKNYPQEKEKILIDSDENYSLGRFKSKLIKYTDSNFNFKSELQQVSHDIEKMANRIKKTYPEAKILYVIREQSDWLISVYKHDVEHYAIDMSFSKFLESPLGQGYLLAGDYSKTYGLYSDLFGKENVKILFYEDLKKNRASFLKDLYSFLGVDWFDQSESKSKNSSASDAQILLLKWINKLSQNRYNKKEYRIYYWVRNLFFNKFKIPLFRGKQIAKNESKMFVKKYYKNSNEKLVQHGVLLKKMHQFKYIQI